MGRETLLENPIYSSSSFDGLFESKNPCGLLSPGAAFSLSDFNRRLASDLLAPMYWLSF